MLCNIEFFKNINNREEKANLAKKIAQKARNGDIIGFGSGSTSYLTVCEIAKRVKEENLDILAVPTSSEILIVCEQLGIKTTSLYNKKLNWSFDGADEVDSNNWLIKGRGAAMYKEKLNIVNSNIVYILVDDTKIVDKLCDKYAIPVECQKDSVIYVMEQLKDLGGKSIQLRLAEQGKDGPIITENGNFIIDVKFDEIDDNLEKKLKSIVGVFETGLFINYNNIIIEKNKNKC